MATPTNNTESIVVDRTVRILANTKVYEYAGNTSRLIGILPADIQGKASIQSNGYYYMEDMNGWVKVSNTVLIKDNKDPATKESSEEAQEESWWIDSETKRIIQENMTIQQQEQIMVSYINTEYGSQQTDAAVGEELLLDNLSGVYGIPYQFPESVDPRFGSNSFGGIYGNRIIARMPLLMLSPGKVEFMKNATNGEKLTVFDALLGSENDEDYKLSEFVNSPGKYYTFAYDTENYWKYVNAMNNACAVYLGIQDVEINVNGVTERAGDFHWQYATNNKFENFLISSESYITFYADAETSKSENYSNTTKASQLADTVNSFSDIAKEAQFLVGAHIGNLGWLDEGQIRAAVDEIGGLSNKLLNGKSIIEDIAKEFSVIATGGKLIFPEIWSDSEFSQSFDVKIKLRCPCPNKVSWFLDICVPINHLRALTLPRTPYGDGIDGKKFEDSATANGYFTPFLVRGFYKGLWNCDMGIITDLSLSLGKEGSWTIDGLPSEVDVDMTIKDLYNVLAMTSSDQPSQLLNNTMFLNFLASSCGVNINRPDIIRSVELYAMVNSNYWTDKFSLRTYWQKAQLGIQNAVYNAYRGIFPY